MTLQGVRIWLCGSIPQASESEAERIRRFVRVFAAEVFRRGGRLIHGSHPSIRDDLLQVAREYKHKKQTGEKAGLVLAVSRFFSKEPTVYGIDLEAWNDLCAEVVETPEGLSGPTAEQTKRREALNVPSPLEAWEEPVEGASVSRDSVPRADRVWRDESLKILRDTMVEKCNAVVALGGKWWEVAADKAGVPEEVELLRRHHLPLFLLGALGGSLRAYLQARPELLRECMNGLTEAQNRELAELGDPNELAGRICDQLERLPLRARREDTARPFRILCLSGGGIRGIFTAAVLRRWEEMTDLKIIDHFDMIAGTSTGGILAIGLGLGMTPAQMEKFYQDQGETIFPLETGIRSLTHSVRHWFRSAYDASILRQALTAAYPVKPPKYLTRLVIPVYNSETDLPIVFRAWPDSVRLPYRTFDPVEVALATGAAPTYFNPNRIGHIRAVDGGVWANAPLTIALAEAIHGLGIESDRIRLLSVGTTYDTKLLGQPAQIDRDMIEALVRPATNGLIAKLVGWLWKPMPIHGKLGWLPNIAGFLMKTQSQTVEYVCKRVLGDRFVHVDRATEPTNLDDIKAMNRLIGLGEDVADEFLDEVSTQFLNGVPIVRP